MSFVTPSDFDVPPYSIPNLDKVINTFTSYVTEQETYILEKLLGVQLCAAFLEGLTVTPVENIEQKWKDLRDGKDYTYGGKTYKWKGMKDLLRPYMYAVWLRDSFDTHTGIGIVQGNAENAVVLNPSERIVRAWNQFAWKAGVERKRGYLEDEVYGTRDYRFREFYEYYNCENTLYGFLEANRTVYEGWEFDDPGTMNILNL